MIDIMYQIQTNDWINLNHVVRVTIVKMLVDIQNQLTEYQVTVALLTGQTHCYSYNTQQEANKVAEQLLQAIEKHARK